MLTRELIEHRLRKLATNCQVFAGRKSTSAGDRRWATEAIATLATLTSATTQPERETEVQPCR